MKNIATLCAALTSAFLLTGALSQAQTPTYNYQKVSYPATYATFATAIADDGRVVGWYTDFVHVNGFLDKNGTYSTIQSPSINVLSVTAISGSTLYGSSAYFGFSVDAQGNFTALKTPDGFGAFPSAANAKGVVVGEVQGKIAKAFVLQNGVYKTFTAPGSDVTSFASVNDQGAIVGTWAKKGNPTQSFELVNGQMTPIFFPGSYSTIVTGINDAGEMVGWYYKTAQGPLGLFSYNGTSYTDIETPPNSYACMSGNMNNLG